MSISRCTWCSNDPLYIAYHDDEWGKACRDEAYLFEMLCLEAQQAGLSWITVLKKRDCYRQHFFQYSIAQIAQLSDAELQHKQQDAGLIRHLAKLTAIRDNAIAWQRLKKNGFKFLGPTSCYAFMQAVGMVNDHENHCAFKDIQERTSS